MTRLNAPAADPRRSERGAVLPFVVLAMMVLLGCAALAIDVGDTMLHKRRLQSAVDLGVLAGAQKLPDTAAAAAAARDVIERNWATRDDSQVALRFSTGCKVAGCARPDKLSVNADAEVPTTFARVFGIDELPVVSRGAACGPCETSTRKYDVMVVLDRSYSMCVDSSGVPNDCYDLKQAKAAIKSLLGFFDPANDTVGLAALSSGDSNPPFDHSEGQFPCDSSAQHSYSGVGRFKDNLGDFMDGTPDDHDSWVLAPLGKDFKDEDGALDPFSPMVHAVDCVQAKAWTPIAPAIEAATQELAAHGRKDPGVQQVIVFLGDGGANAQPMKRDPSGVATAEKSWYTATPGNDLQPCHDAVGQAAVAKAAGIEVYTVAYDLNATTAQQCYTDNLSGVPAYLEPGIDARSTMKQMASGSKNSFERVGPGDLTAIFDAIGREIVLGGTRLVE